MGSLKFKKYFFVCLVAKHLTKLSVIIIYYLLSGVAHAGEPLEKDEAHDFNLNENGIEDFKSHDLGINFPVLIFGAAPALDLTYQYWLNENLGVRLHSINGWGGRRGGDVWDKSEYSYGFVLSKNILTKKTVYLFAERAHYEINFEFIDASRVNEYYNEVGKTIGLGYSWGEGNHKLSIEYAKKDFTTRTTTWSSGNVIEVFPKKYLAIKLVFIW